MGEPSARASPATRVRGLSAVERGGYRAPNLGIEEDVMLLDPGNWAVANKIDPVSEALSPGFTSHATAETHACVIGRLPGSVHEVLLERLGLHAATAGTRTSFGSALGGCGLVKSPLPGDRRADAGLGLEDPRRLVDHAAHELITLELRGWPVAIHDVCEQRASYVRHGVRCAAADERASEAQERVMQVGVAFPADAKPAEVCSQANLRATIQRTRPSPEPCSMRRDPRLDASEP